MKSTVATLNLEFSLPDLDFKREHGTVLHGSTSAEEKDTFMPYTPP